MSEFNYVDSLHTLLEIHGAEVVIEAIGNKFCPRTLSAMCEMSREHALRLGVWNTKGQRTNEAQLDSDVFLASHSWLMEVTIDYFGIWPPARSEAVARHLYTFNGFVIPEEMRNWAISHLDENTTRVVPPVFGDLTKASSHCVDDLYSITGVLWWEIL